ncbi:hypothetical protein PO124_16485 [Bacillus licheniformis]|nr:hypothetical protein [Bacillus licheniformis]
MPLTIPILINPTVPFVSPLTFAPIHIEENCNIGIGASILAGVTIGAHSKSEQMPSSIAIFPVQHSSRRAGKGD